MARAETNDIVVVGGGLVGSLLSVVLRARGHPVTVYERRPDIRGEEVEAGRSINLVLTRRGIRALRMVGLEEQALALTVPVMGRMMHPVEGELAYQPYGKDDSECNYSISRAGLNEFLVRAAAERGVRFRFRSRLVDADLGTRRLVFADDSRGGQQFEVQAGVLFGADGAGSAVRAAFKKLDGFEESVEILEHGYKELQIPAAEGGGFRIEKNALHIWPRGEFMLMALPNLDGSFTVTLYLPYRGRHGFEEIKTPEDVLGLFREYFPDAIPLIPDLADSFLGNPTGELGTVRCRPWHRGGRALLIGDAAHAIVPFFGQGMNTGFEDCTVLDALLESQGGAWHELFTRFTRRRKPNGDAIAEMALDNFVEMRDRVGDEAFLLRKQVERRLEQEMPSEYRSRYSMVMYSHIPFRLAQQAGRIEEEILAELCAGLESADRVDLTRARALIGERLTPFLREHGIRLDY